MLNIAGLIASKLDVVEQLALEYNVTIILQQEIHCQCLGKLVLNNYKPAGYTLSKRHCLVTFIMNNLSWKLSDSSRENSGMEWQCL